MSSHPGTGAIAFIVPYAILSCLLCVFSVPLTTSVVIEILAIAGGLSVAAVEGGRFDLVRIQGGTTASTDAIALVLIGGVIGAKGFVLMAELGVWTVAVSVLGVAALSWIAAITLVFWEGFTLFFLLIGTLPGQVTFIALMPVVASPALAMLIAVIVGATTTGMLCRWVCGQEVWSLPGSRAYAKQMAWGGGGIWAIFCAWTLTFAQVPPDSLHSSWILVIAIVLSVTTILLMKATMSELPTSLALKQAELQDEVSVLAIMIFVSSLIGFGVGWLINLG